jgi:hypothetical protein
VARPKEAKKKNPPRGGPGLMGLPPGE